MVWRVSGILNKGEAPLVGELPHFALSRDQSPNLLSSDSASQCRYNVLVPNWSRTLLPSSASIHFNRLWLAEVSATKPGQPGTAEPAAPKVPSNGAPTKVSEHVVPPEVTHFYEEGMKLRKEGKWEEAKTLFEKAIEIAPKFYEARVERGVMLFNLRQKEEAKTEIKKVLDEDPENMSAKVASTIFTIFDPAARDFDGVVQILEKALKVAPDHVRANYLMGRALMRAGRDVEAISYLRRIEELDPDNRIYLSKLERARYVTGKKARTIPNLEESLERYPDELFLNLALGALYMDANRPADALPHYEKVVEAEPEIANVQFLFGECLFSLGRDGEALGHFKKAVELGFGQPVAHSFMGKIYYKQGKYDEAIARFKRAIELGSKKSTDHWNLAFLFQEKGRIDEAIEFYGRALDLEKDFSHRPYSYGRYITRLIERGRYSEAIAVANRCISMLPTAAIYHCLKGLALDLSGSRREDFEEAAREYELAFSEGLEEDFVVAVTFRLTRIYVMELQRYDDAISLTQAVLKKDIDDNSKARAYSIIGAALYEQERHGEALPYFEQGYALDPKNESILDLLADTHRHLGNHEVAIGLFEKLLEINPDYHEQAYFWLSELYFKEGEIDKGIEILQKAVERFPEKAEVYARYSMALSIAGRHREVRRVYERALGQFTEKANIHAWYGLTLSNAGRHEEAIQVYRKALELDPSLGLRAKIGESLVEFGRPTEAIGILEDAVRKDPDKEFALFILGKALFEAGEYDRAITILRELTERNPQHIKGLRKLAWAYEEKGLAGEAVETRRRVIELNPDSHWDHSLLAGALGQAGRYDEAVREYGVAIDLKPEEGHLYQFFGKFLHDQGKFREAIEVMERGLRIAPKLPALHLQMSIAYEAVGDYSRAIGHCRKVVEFGDEEDKARGHSCLGFLCNFRKRYKEAEQEFRAAIDLDSEWKVPQSRYGLGSTFIHQKRYKEAIRLLRVAKEKAPSLDVELRRLLAIALYHEKRFDEAISELQALWRATPDSVETCKLLGAVLSEAGKRGEAVGLFGECRALDPDDPEVLNGLGYELTQEGKVDDAIEYLNRALGLDPGNHHIQDSLGFAYFKAGRYDEALSFYQEAFKGFEEMGEDNYEMRLHLGIALLQRGQVDEAMKHLEKATELNPADEEVQKALRAAHEIKAGGVASIPTPTPLRDFRRLSMPVYTRDLRISAQTLGEVERDVQKRLRAAELGFLAEHSRRLIRGHRPAEAVAVLRRSIELDQENSSLHAQMGDVLMELGRYGQAIKSYERALGLDESNMSAKRGRERAIKKRKESFDFIVDQGKALPLRQSEVKESEGR